MKTTVKTSDFVTAISLISGSIDKRANNPLLTYCLMEAKNGFVNLTGYDFKTMTKISIAGETSVEGGVLFSPQIALPLCQKLQSDTVTFLAEHSQLSINQNYQIECLSVDDYPILPSLSGEFISLPVEDLQRHLSFALVAISNEEHRGILTGINISGTGNTIAIAATDGHRLAMSEFSSSAQIPNVTVAGDGVRQLLKLLKKWDGDVQILLDNSHVQFVAHNYTFTSRLLNGMYPDYRKLIPKDFASRVVLERKSLIHALDCLSVLVGRRNVIKFSINSDLVTLTTEKGEFGNGQEHIPAQIEGDALDVAFNIKYILDGLKAISTAQVNILLNSATAPVVFSPIDGDQSLYLVMPILLRD